jgi:hypothetical protein
VFPPRNAGLPSHIPGRPKRFHVPAARLRAIISPEILH